MAACLGGDLNLAPVADVVPAGLGARNAPIGLYGREFGSTAAAVTRTATRATRPCSLPP
ncbi:hypothetical protein ACFYM0_02905 [Streptomyces sp. NPDC006487]|uniref:hypothetical protein n=1 Tax=Streptomyces sp. NPDC006487 TaxID=3364748 RepID=UPI0036A394A1